MDIQITKAQAAAAFTEWEREFRENPEQFMKDEARRASTAETYGERCAETFVDYLAKFTAPA